MRRVVLVVMGVLLAVAVLPLLPATPAGATAGTPVNVAPVSGSTVGTNPVFEWQPAAGALRYLFEISQSPTMAPLVPGGSLGTTNTKLTFASELPASVTLYWRVTAYDTPAGPGGAAVGPIWTLTKNKIAAPTGLVPSNTPGSPKIFKYPSEAPTFSWSPVPGAKNYELIVDNDASFTPPFIVGPVATSNTSFTLATPVTLDQEFFWKVRSFATDSTPSSDSETGAFELSWRNPANSPLVPAPFSPPNTNSPPIEQVDFAWAPVPGAKLYDVQWSLSDLFTSPITVRTKSTRYSPPTTLDNGAYFWRVRGVTAIDGLGAWSSSSRFARAWPAVNSTPEQLGSIKLLTPKNAAVFPESFQVAEPTFSWSPQRLASRYQVELSTDSNFSPGLTTSCITNHTTLTPVSNCNVNPGPNTLFYWRVKALDDPRPVNGEYSEAFTFIYRPPLLTQTGPANGADTSAPVLTWDVASSNLIGRYRVTVWNELGQVVKQVDTYNTSLVGGTTVGSYAPDGLSVLPAQSLHTWKVQTIDIAGRVGPVPAGSRSFNMVAPASPVSNPNPTSPNAALGTRVPPLTWTPVTGADRYNVWYSVNGANLYSPLVVDWRSSAYAHPTSSVSPGTYDWFIEAENSSGVVISSTNVTNQTFQVVNLTQSQPVAPANCTSLQSCDPEYDTPTLDWLPVIGATHYKVYLAYDVNFTNIVLGTPYETQYSTLTPLISLADNQASQAYYWYARPCYSKAPERCGPEPASFAGQPGSPVWAFQKQSNKLTLNAPTTGAKVGNPGDANYTPGSQITFSWKGFLQTNCKTPATPTVLCQPPPPLDPRIPGVAPIVTQEARLYRIEVSDRADFSTLVDSAEVDQLTYTAFNKTYPEGPLFWRVAPIDGSNNRLAWSGNGPLNEPDTLTKSSPLPVPDKPVANATVANGVPTLTVTPQAFEAEWEFELYRNVNQPLSTTNRVFLKKASIAAVTPTDLLPPGVYGWRVRRFDADNRAGAWSALSNAELRTFTLAGQGVNLTTPSNGATIAGDRLFFEWNTVGQATRYKFEVNALANFTGTKPEQDVITVTNQWAPRITYAEDTYYWRVSTLDASGNVLATSAVRSFNTGEVGSRYVSIPPIRVVDSRTGPGWTGRVQAGSPRPLKIAGPGLSAPSDATAVVLNVTAVESSAQSFMTVYPTGSPIPNPGSALNFNAGQIIPNLVTVKVGTNGSINFATSVGNVNVVADLVGYYDVDSGDRYNSLTPFRLLDSRETGTSAYWNPVGKLNNNQSRDLQVTGRGGVPGDAKAVIVNLTAVEGSVQSFVTAYPTGSPKPIASNVNFVAGEIIPNLAIVKVGTGGMITLYNNSGSVNVIVDVVGYFDVDAGNYFHPLVPNRILDTRNGNGLNGVFTATQTRTLQVGGRGGVPAGAAAVVMNTTAVESTAPSYLMLFPGDADKPANASNLNFVTGQIIPNLVTVGLSPTGTISIYNNSSSVHVLGDVTGYYSAF